MLNCAVCKSRGYYLVEKDLFRCRKSDTSLPIIKIEGVINFCRLLSQDGTIREVLIIITNELFELIRRHQNMTQEEFADLLGISRKTVSAIERNKRPVSKRTEHKLIQKVPISDSLLNYKMRHDSLKEFIKTEVSQ